LDIGDARTPRAAICSQKNGRGGLYRLLPTKILIFGVNAKSAMATRRAAHALSLWPLTAKLATKRFIVPGRKSRPANFNGFRGERDATIVPMRTANTPNSGSINIAIIGITIPLAVMVPEIPISLDRGIRRKIA